MAETASEALQAEVEKLTAHIVKLDKELQFLATDKNEMQKDKQHA